MVKGFDTYPLLNNCCILDNRIFITRVEYIQIHTNRTATVLEWYDRHKTYDIWFKRRKRRYLSCQSINQSGSFRQAGSGLPGTKYFRFLAELLLVAEQT